MISPNLIFQISDNMFCGTEWILLKTIQLMRFLPILLLLSQWLRRENRYSNPLLIRSHLLLRKFYFLTTSEIWPGERGRPLVGVAIRRELYCIGRGQWQVMTKDHMNGSYHIKKAGTNSFRGHSDSMLRYKM